ncbi:MAG TPA: amidohydrolase family protein [Chitinophagaceae bacterium]|jgi:imidazolonepropionase-like amidohydrolase|nr:amidohydrolase family protein [Chitinophagaceae bacterium]
MSKYFFILFVFLVHSASAQLLIKNTNVVDVENNKILSGYDVLVKNDKIVSIEKTKQIKVNTDTKLIDGSSKYLIPGFADAHVHFFQSGGLFTRPDAIDLRKYQPYDKEIKWVHDHMEDFLRLYTSAGITSVIDPGSTFNFLQQKDSFSNKTYAPIIYMSGPLLTTYVPDAFKDLEDSPFILMTSEDQTREGVRSELPYKPDFIKIWYIVRDTNTERGARQNLSMVKAAIDEAHKNNLRVAVHATQRITAQLAVEAGADYLVHSVDDEILADDFLQLLKKNNTVLCPTLIVAGNYGKVLGNNYHFTKEELEITHPVPAASIINYPQPDTVIANTYIKRISDPARIARRKRANSIMAVNLKKLLDAGVTIATGTDAGNLGTQHASSYFIELKVMQHAGLNNWQLLQASTINVAKILGKQNEWGSIAKGKTANMVLLSANPLDNLANWRKIDWIINKGVALKPASLVTKIKTDAR